MDLDINPTNALKEMQEIGRWLRKPHPSKLFAGHSIRTSPAQLEFVEGECSIREAPLHYTPQGYMMMPSRMFERTISGTHSRGG